MYSHQNVCGKGGVGGGESQIKKMTVLIVVPFCGQNVYIGTTCGIAKI